jgi:hypothetical protein
MDRAEKCLHSLLCFYRQLEDCIVGQEPDDRHALFKANQVVRAGEQPWAIFWASSVVILRDMPGIYGDVTESRNLVQRLRFRASGRALARRRV